MNIQLLIPKTMQVKYDDKMSFSKSAQLPARIQTLNADTVSFTGVGSSTHKFSKKATNTISDYIEKGLENNMQRMHRIATTYLDVLECIANSLSKDGFSFDRAYCELSPVKSPKSYVSKIARSGNMKVHDSIRATLYCNNSYDLSLISQKL